MGQYAPGTQNFDAGISRRDSRVFQRRQNVSDILAGFGAIAQTLGQVRRAHEAEANDALYTQKLGELMQGGVSPQQPPAITAQNVPAMAEDVPQGWQGYQPPTPAPSDPGPSYDAGVMQATQPSASSFLERMGRTFTPWTSGGYQPKLSGQQAASLIQMRQGMAAQAGASARESRRLALDEAQAAETARHNRATEGDKAGEEQGKVLGDLDKRYTDALTERGQIKARLDKVKVLKAGGLTDAALAGAQSQYPDDPMIQGLVKELSAAGLSLPDRKRLLDGIVASTEQEHLGANARVEALSPFSREFMRKSRERTGVQPEDRASWAKRRLGEMGVTPQTITPEQSAALRAEWDALTRAAGQ